MRFYEKQLKIKINIDNKRFLCGFMKNIFHKNEKKRDTLYPLE